MALQGIVDFFRDITFVQGFIASLFATFVAGIAVFLWRRRKGRCEPSVPSKPVVIKTGEGSVSQTAVGDDVHQDLKVDKSHPQSGGVHIERVESGTTLTPGINPGAFGLRHHPKYAGKNPLQCRGLKEAKVRRAGGR